MKVVYKDKIDNHTVIRFLDNAAVDSEKTKEKIAPLITEDMTEEEVEQLYMANLVYASVGHEAELVDIETGEHLQQKLNEREANQLLLESGDFIADYRGTEFWVKTSGKWVKEKIEKIGIALPVGAILQENLFQQEKEQAEIAVQEEEDRLAKLTPKQLAVEKEAEIAKALREVSILKGEYEIVDKPFDAKAEFKLRKDKIYEKYNKFA